MNLSFKIPSADLLALANNPALLLDKVSTPIWNRLEARPRGEDMTRALKAELRDAAWMLSRQWQMGEFAADDAGTPVYSNLRYTCSPFNDASAPFEPRVESQTIFDPTYPDLRNLNVRLQMGSYWLRLVTENSNVKNLRDSFLENPEFNFPEAVPGIAPDVAQFLQFYQGRSIDGYKFYNYYKDKSRFDSYGNKADELKGLYDTFSNWYNKAYLQPAETAPTAWNGSRLEYSFESSATVRSEDPAQQLTKTVVADEYYHGRLDWYNFNLRSVTAARAGAELGQVQEREYHIASDKKLIPTPIRFSGMPEARYWTFEDNAVNFAAVNVDRNNIGKLALIEFGMVYSNDWSIVPLDAPVGCFIDVDSLVVIDSFGKETVIPPVTDVNPGNLEWKFFTLSNEQKGQPQDTSMLLPQTITRAQQGKPLEEVNFIRDEMANMVWGIETVIPSPLGHGISGREQNRTAPAPDNGDKWFYVERTTTPLNWIPFLPIKNNENRLVLRRGKLLADNGAIIRPNTSLLRKGLDKNSNIGKDANGKSIVYDIEDNEVPREGVNVTKAYQRTRWTNGEVIVWLGMQKESGKREGRSNLNYDQLVRKTINQ
jgi:hypothetical protein